MTRVCPSRDLVEGHPRVVAMGGVNVAVLRVGSEVFVREDYCPHRGAPLSEGELSGTTLTCPWHGARFDLRSGNRVGVAGGRGVRVYPVQDDGEEVTLAQS